MPSSLCTIEHWLQLALAVFAALAAVAWLRASLVKAPSPPARFSNIDEAYIAVGRKAAVTPRRPSSPASPRSSSSSWCDANPLERRALVRVSDRMEELCQIA